ncbi:hypothetical protein ACFOLF_06140 [Paenibacillus sepulcri]|uniref:Uncharacterized protein n=1 Tax=Paenibacillus sepulcri TaxID=359917 RepID=A0ABS7BX51_9BACL|nr:hypothetical protein [Paenibacillus sepulcri]
MKKLICAAAAACLCLCTGCVKSNVEPAMTYEDGHLQSISTDVYPLSRSIFGDVYGLKRDPENKKPGLTEEKHVGKGGGRLRDE